MRKSLDALRQHDADVAAGSRKSSNVARLNLVAEAAEKLWGYVVQRELVGLRDAEYIRDQYKGIAKKLDQNPAGYRTQ